ncbi:2671c301-db52-4d01-a499-a5e37c229ee0 [Thermothielavioides terrestris]|uniref:2671c301-db52-4d01-a499-a5e37c229ee0 n=1 Tax=Thermothielavioides terrestris TaxID=2587410 RepID=A0A3S4C8I7_9PEZI|nr:2671c301-db52-4d01-a499-a5e37c229ee0 [Thermothielavioides terrestris]
MSATLHRRHPKAGSYILRPLLLLVVARPNPRCHAAMLMADARYARQFQGIVRVAPRILMLAMVLLYALPRGTAFMPGLLVDWYCLALLTAWILANTAGETKKSAMMALFNAASAAGAIVGPLLFGPADGPRPGVAVLALLNVAHARIANGKDGRIHAHSTEDRYVDMRAQHADTVGSRAFAGRTECENDQFVCAY